MKALCDTPSAESPGSASITSAHGACLGRTVDCGQRGTYSSPKSSAHPSISFFIDRSDLNGSKLRQNEMSRHCRSSVASLNRWHNFSTIDSACFSCKSALFVTTVVYAPSQ